MSCDSYLFSLIDKNEKIIESFEPLVTSGRVIWNNYSDFIIISVGQSNSGYLICNLDSLTFGLIKFKKNDFFDISFSKDEIKFSYPNTLLDLLNNAKPFSRKENELPRKKYLKPKDISVKIKDIDFYAGDKLASLFDIVKKLHELEPIENGFWEFNGRFPLTTIDGFNGRDFEVYQLELFAEFGDKQSIEWLDDIKKITNGKYNKWKKVSSYIGFKKRKTATNNS